MTDQRSTTELFSSVQREHVLEAIDLLAAGQETRFHDSTKFDVIYQGRRFPPKAVSGLALELMSGRSFGPKDFSGGESSASFRMLSRCGFTIVKKRDQPSILSLRDVVLTILDLQTQYSSANTEPMQRRGELIRHALPDLIRDRMETLEPIFSASEFECAVEGADGKGRKNMSPWVRIYDPVLSPSAPKGWYVVLHFSSDGLAFYATLGCGATIYKDGSLTPINDRKLSERVGWARDLLATQPGIDRFHDPIELRGNDLSRQFEKATALARAYRLDRFDENGFWSDIEALCRWLVIVYGQDRLGKVPFAPPPEITDSEQAIEEIAHPSRGSTRGQGRGLTASERRAVELRAMIVAHDALVARGFTDIADVSTKESCDYLASHSGTSWRIEVKGTTSADGSCILITAAELKLHREHAGTTILITVSDIDLTRAETGPVASGGHLDLLMPWDITTWTFEPTAYRAIRPTPCSD